jgi:hypothetical protein
MSEPMKQRIHVDILVTVSGLLGDGDARELNDAASEVVTAAGQGLLDWTRKRNVPKSTPVTFDWSVKLKSDQKRPPRRKLVQP